jgi:hypothetical protein
MDPILKVQLFQNLALINDILSLLPRFNNNNNNNDTNTNNNNTNQTNQNPLQTIQKPIYEIPDSQIKIVAYHKKLVQIVDMMFIEIFGCYMKYEEMILPPIMKKTSRTIQQQLQQTSPDQLLREYLTIIPICIQMLTDYLIPEILTNLLYHPINEVAVMLVPAFDKLISFMKQQKIKFTQYGNSIPEHLQRLQQQYFPTTTSTILQFPLWNTQDTLDGLLMGLFYQAHYPSDFPFDDMDNADEDFMEVIYKHSIIIMMIIIII